MDPNKLNPDEFKNLSRYLNDAAKGAKTLEGIMDALSKDGKDVVTHLREVSTTFDQIKNSQGAFIGLMQQQIAASNKFLSTQLDIASATDLISGLEQDFLALLKEGNTEAGYLAQEQLRLYELQAQAQGYSTSAAREYAKAIAEGNFEMKDGQIILSEEVVNNLEILEAKERQLEFIKKGLDLQIETKRRVDEIKNSHNQIRDTIKQELMFAKEMAKDPKLLAAFTAKQLAGYLGQAYAEMKRLMETGMQAGEAVRMMRENFSLMAVLGLSKVSGVSSELVNQFGTMNAMTKEQRHNIGEMAADFGLAEKEAVDLTLAVSRMPGESMETAKNFKNTAVSVGKMSGVLPSQIMKEMAKNSANIAVYSKGGAEGFAKGAAMAKKLGMEMSTVLNAARKTLDFESSINSQLEASVLLGQEMSFDRLRQATLMGDANAIMQEQVAIMNQVGSLDNMNTLQKEKLAEAMGMSVEELTKFNAEQQLNNKYFGENAGMMDNAIGTLMKYGGAIGGAIQQHGTFLLTLLQAGLQLGTYISMMGIKSALQTQDNVQTGVNTTLTATNTAAQVANTAATTASIAPTVAAGNAAKGAGMGMLTLGAAILMAGAGIGLATLGIASLAESIKGMNVGEMLFLGVLLAGVAVGVLLLGKASEASALGLLVFGGTMLMVGAGVMMMGIGLGIAAAGMSLLVASLKDIPVENLIALPLAFMGIGTGLLFMAAAASVAIPAAAGLSVLFGVLVIGALGLAIVSLALESISKHLGSISEASSGLSIAGNALVNMGSGLASIASNGLAALPVIGALMGLAAVAPALSGLGTSLGGLFGGGEGEKEDKMDTLITKIDQLIVVASQGGQVNMDGKKVGEVIRLGLNSAGIR